jgi:hypothetical protein
MSIRNPFETEWRDCLRAHYLHVVKSGDVPTEHTLVSVMQQAGFSDADLVELRIRATIRQDDVDEDFVPDFEAIEAQIAAQAAAALQLPVEATTSKAMASAGSELLQDEISPEADQKAEAPPPSDEYYAPPDDTPRQLSLF